MNKGIAKFISFLFHPLVLPIFAVTLIFYFPSWISNYIFEYKKTIILIIALLTFIIPLLILLILLNLRVITSLNLSIRRERYIPYSVIAFIYTGGYFILNHFPLGIPAAVLNFILIADIVIVILMTLNFRYKISAHMAGIGSFMSFFYVFLLKEVLSDTLFSFIGIDFTILFFLIFLIVVSGLIASARLFLNEHKPVQIISGFCLGFAIGLLSLWMY
jgi:membrane-associated phospholipid phosphatase